MTKESVPNKITREQLHGLEPMPNGCVVALQDPYKKTVTFVRETDWGREPADAPIGYEIPPGYTMTTYREG